MSLLKANSVQIGQSSTATQNFTLSVPASPDGTIKLARGNSGATTADIVNVDSSGNVIISGNKSLISNGAGGIATNTSIGSSALASNTTGFQNTANGASALYSNTTGSYNTASGQAALFSNTTGFQNTASGQGALYSNTTGFYNTVNGTNALYSNTTGYNNTANGYQALVYNTTGYSNAADGTNALYSNTTGYLNTAKGTNVLYSNTTGNQNTAIGYQAGYGAGGTNANTTGSNNTFLGNEAVGSSATASNVITLGNSAIATLRCQVTTITALSDRRDKKNIVPLSGGLGLINVLNPVSFVWDMRDGKKVGIPEIGFIAQELEEAQKQSGFTVPNLVYADNPERLEASPATLIPILVKAIQELSQKVNQLEAKLKG